MMKFIQARFNLLEFLLSYSYSFIFNCKMYIIILALFNYECYKTAKCELTGILY